MAATDSATLAMVRQNTRMEGALADARVMLETYILPGLEKWRRPEVAKLIDRINRALEPVEGK